MRSFCDVLCDVCIDCIDIIPKLIHIVFLFIHLYSFNIIFETLQSWNASFPGGAGFRKGATKTNGQRGHTLDGGVEEKNSKGFVERVSIR